MSAGRQREEGKVKGRRWGSTGLWDSVAGHGKLNFVNVGLCHCVTAAPSETSCHLP